RKGAVGRKTARATVRKVMALSRNGTSANFALPARPPPTARRYAGPRACASVSRALDRARHGDSHDTLAARGVPARRLHRGRRRGAAAHTVLVNGKILTLDARSSVQQALAIRDGKIASLGGDAQIRKLA